MREGKSKRAKYFVEPIYSILKSNEEIDKKTFFKNNYYALSEIFALETDTTYMNFLIEEDSTHKASYLMKMKKRKKRKRAPKDNKVPDNDTNI